MTASSHILPAKQHAIPKRRFCRAIQISFLILGLLSSTDLAADTIVLKNGTRIENVAAWKDGNQIRCFRFNSVVGYPTEDVLQIMAGPVRPALPPPKKRDVESAGAKVLTDREAGRFRVEHLFDGDSLKLTDGNLIVHVRIAGIDAPERGNRKTRTAGQPYSKKSADHLKRLVSGRSIRIRGYGLDAYQRRLAELFVDGRNIGLAMVEAGYAEVYAGRTPEGLDLTFYRAAERRARKYGRGMWAQGRMYISPRRWRAAHPR